MRFMKVVENVGEEIDILVITPDKTASKNRVKIELIKKLGKY